MADIDCCRTCLSNESLNPIFLEPKYHKKYSEAVFLTTGLQVERNDDLPQTMCTDCINFVNYALKFRNKSRNAETTLLERRKVKTSGSEADFSNADLDSNTNDELEIDTGCDEIAIKNKEDSITVNVVNVIDDNTFKTDTKEDLRDIVSQQESEDLKLPPFNELKPFEQNDEERIDKNEDEVERSGDDVDGNSAGKNKEDEDWVWDWDCHKKPVARKADEKYECNVCHKILSSRGCFKTHLKIHTGFDYVCEHCGKSFINKRVLLTHCRAKHDYEKTDKCSFCDYKASNPELVKIHERLHTGEKPYICAECGAGFHRNSNYLQHIAIHLPEKTVQCDQCPSRFKSLTLMRIHKDRRHKASQYQYKCYECHNTFARRRNAVIHLRRVHKVPPDQLRDIERIKR